MISTSRPGRPVVLRYPSSSIFWTPAFGLRDDSIDPVLEENLVHQIEEVNDNFEDEPITGPTFFTSSTKWRPRPLRTLEEFFFAIDKQKPDFLEQLKNKGDCREEIESLG